MTLGSGTIRSMVACTIAFGWTASATAHDRNHGPGFYLEGGPGVVFFDPPERDDYNVYTLQGGEVTGQPFDFDAEDVRARIDYGDMLNYTVELIVGVRF